MLNIIRVIIIVRFIIMKELIKSQNLGNAIIRFVTFLISILFLEFTFIIFVFNKLCFENIINILLNHYLPSKTLLSF